MTLVLISISIFILKGQEERVKSIMEPGPIFSIFIVRGKEEKVKNRTELTKQVQVPIHLM